MGATDSNGIWKYDYSDTINGWPTYGNLLANSVSNVFTDIRPKAIYTASSQSDANTKVTALKASGLTPSTAAPFFFWRSDAGTLWAYNNSTWIRITPPDNTAWSDLSSAFASGVSGSLKGRKIGDATYIVGSVTFTPNLASNATMQLATLSASWLPSINYRYATGAGAFFSGNIRLERSGGGLFFHNLENTAANKTTFTITPFVQD